MPTYRNDSVQRAIYNNTVWQPGETKEVPFMVPPALTSLVKISDNPPIDLFVISAVGELALDEDVVFTLPEQPLEDVLYTLNITCPSKGQLEVYINTTNNKITLMSGWGMRGPYLSNILSGITVKGIAEENDYTVLVEKTRAAPNVIVS